MKKSSRAVSASCLPAEFRLQPLEGRVLLSAATLTPGTVLTKADRQALLAAWNGPDKAQLKADLAAGKYTACV
jgi:hypothetical protein